MSFDECSHQYKLLGRTVSSWHRYPPVIGKMKICGRCGAIHAGLNSVTAAGNYIDMTHAAAPGNPSAGSARIYSVSNTTMNMRDSSGNIKTLAGTSSTASALELENSNASEVTTTSGSETDLLTVASLDIAATKPFMIWAIVRASGSGVTFGLKLNTTQVVPASTVVGTGSAVLWAYVGPRVTNQLRALTGWSGYGTTSGTGSLAFFKSTTADHPTATITQVTITADSNGSTTAGADELRVYEMATS